MTLFRLLHPQFAHVSVWFFSYFFAYFFYYFVRSFFSGFFHGDEHGSGSSNSSNATMEISAPTNFQHTGGIGWNAAEGKVSGVDVNCVDVVLVVSVVSVVLKLLCVRCQWWCQVSLSLSLSLLLLLVRIVVCLSLLEAVVALVVTVANEIPLCSLRLITSHPSGVRFSKKLVLRRATCKTDRYYCNPPFDPFSSPLLFFLTSSLLSLPSSLLPFSPCH